MTNQSILDKALGGHKKAPNDLMLASQVRPFIYEDPGIVWLKFHGKEHGLLPNGTTPYEFTDFIFAKGREFEDKWVKKIIGNAARVCEEAYEVTSPEKVIKTFELMQKQTPVIAQAAIWWAPEKIYGVPDLLIHTSYLLEESNGILDESEKRELLELIKGNNNEGFYIVFDLKFTTKLDGTNKATDLVNYAAQVRIYSYMLGHLQGYMPNKSYLITRDRITSALPVPIISKLNESLDQDLADIRDKFLEIKLNGQKYVPWKDPIVAINIHNQDDQWSDAKKEIAWNKIPGKDAGLLYQIGPKAKVDLAGFGFANLDSMLKIKPENIPFEKCSGLGSAKSKRIRAVLEANKSGKPVIPPSSVIPVKKPYEFFVDFEYFTNINVDFEKQWPTLEGCEMIFLIGVGWEENEQWNFKTFTAAKEDQQEELEMIEEFLEFLENKTENKLTEDNVSVLYHWSSAEVWQTRKVIERHSIDKNSPIHSLPWYDLLNIFNNGPASVPGAWGFGLKEVAKSLGKLYPQYNPEWPGDLDAGLTAMVMGWKAYENKKPLETIEMSNIKEYLEADCKALWNVLKWLRAGTSL